MKHLDDKASEDQIFNALPGVFGDTPPNEKRKTPAGDAPVIINNPVREVKKSE